MVEYILNKDQDLLLRTQLGEDLAASGLVRSAYAAVCQHSLGSAPQNALILSSTLRPLFNNSAHYVAIALLHNVVHTRGTSFLAHPELQELLDLKEDLSYFAPVTTTTQSFSTMSSRLSMEADRLLNVGDELKIIKLACLAGSIKRREWTTLLQRQHLLERAAVFCEKLKGSSGRIDTWLNVVNIAIKGTRETSKPIASAFSRALST